MDLVTRKGVEACRRLKAFDVEFDAWIKASAQGNPFQRHGSQIRALETMLKAFRGAVAEVIACSEAQTPKTQLDLATSADAARLALALFGIWDFFRVKLDQRRSDSYSDPLRYADELAWLCYKPAREKGLKEPPLVFFSGGTSPFILKRDVRFYADSVPMELAGSDSVSEATSRLPFPVIGVPWTQLNHLPDGVVIAHEVGHAVEADLKLQENLDTAIDVALARSGGKARGEYWRKWRSEIFADMYGCLSFGPVFTSALRDFMAMPESTVQAEEPSLLSSYPPSSVRIRFNAAALAEMKFDWSGVLWSEWRETYPNAAALEPFLNDAVEIAGEFHASPFPALSGKPLTSLITFTEDQMNLANTIASKAAAKDQLPNTSDIRVLFAASRLAYDADPTGYDVSLPAPAKSTLERIRMLIAASVKDVYRSGETPSTDAAGKAHQARGREWMNSIRARIRV